MITIDLENFNKIINERYEKLKNELNNNFDTEIKIENDSKYPYIRIEYTDKDENRDKINRLYKKYNLYVFKEEEQIMLNFFEDYNEETIKKRRKKIEMVIPSDYVPDI